MRTSTSPTDASHSEDAKGAKEDRHFISALARGLDLLACFSSSETLLGNQEMARLSKLPKSTVSRFTYTLTKLGYLDYIEQLGKYRLGSATLALGSAMLSKLDVRRLARPFMQELAIFSRGMVSLGMRDRLSMIYIENQRSQSAITLSLDVGSRIPILTTAMGRAYLAEVTTSERNEIFDQVRGRDAKGWPALWDGVARALDEYGTHGYCTSFGEWQKDVNAIAIALAPVDGLACQSINCGGPAFSLTPQFLLSEVRPRLRDLIDQIQHQRIADATGRSARRRPDSA